MESELMRLDLEAFLNAALERDRPGWPVKRSDYTAPTPSDREEILNPRVKTDLRWMCGARRTN